MEKVQPLRRYKSVGSTRQRTGIFFQCKRGKCRALHIIQMLCTITTQPNGTNPMFTHNRHNRVGAASEKIQECGSNSTEGRGHTATLMVSKYQHFLFFFFPMADLEAFKAAACKCSDNVVFSAHVITQLRQTACASHLLPP